MNLSNHKTVVILDRCLYFNESSKHLVDFDVFMKVKAPTGGNPIAPTSKSLWTCNAEAALEYARIVYDIFPNNKLLYFIVNDSQPTPLNNWSSMTQNLNHISSSLASKAKDFLASSRQKPNQSVQDNSSLLDGLCLALKALCEPSPKQQIKMCRQKKMEMSENCGRIVCLSSFKSNDMVEKLENSFQEALILQNQLVSSGDASLPIKHCHLVMVDVVPMGHSNKCSKILKRCVTPLLTSELHCSRSGIEVFSKLVELTMNHYDLALTSIIGIPMKEEQNALSSANYDVELLHCKEAHSELISSGYMETCTAKSKEILEAQTIPLKWCTPKVSASGMEMQQCFAAHRVTPVDVNSRPSLCLTNFLLGGKSVMLEHVSKSGVKCISHMLTSHAGEIFIHSLVAFRSPLEDPPSIIEGPGGRLTDYRIQDFGELMKTCRLAPMTCTDTGEPAIERAKRQLERMTRHWPLVISDTAIFNMTSVVDPLPALLTKEVLSEMELRECLTVIHNLAVMENKNEPLPATSTGSRAGKSMKREEQYKQMFAELEKLIRAHSETSENHAKVLIGLLDRRQSDAKPSNDKTTNQDVAKKPAEERRHEAPKRELESSDKFLPSKKFMSITSNLRKGRNLLSLWEDHLKERNKPTKRDFFGFSASVNNKYELYQQLEENQNESNDVLMDEKVD